MKGLRKGFQGAAVILLACAMLLAACGKSTNGGSETNAPDANMANENAGGNTASGDSPSEEPAAPELEPYVVQLMYPGSPQKDEQAVEAEMNKILQAKINATIDIQPIDWGAWGDKTNLIFASGDKADLIFTASWNGYGQNAAKGAYVELTDEMMQKFAPDVLTNINPLVTNAYKVNGKLYAVPTNKELAANAGLLIRKDIADKYGMDLSGVKTLKDMEPFFQTVKEKEPDMVPLYMSSGNYVAEYMGDFDSMGDNNIPGGIRPANGSTKVEEFINVPDNLENIKTTRDFYLKGYINKDEFDSTRLVIYATAYPTEDIQRRSRRSNRSPVTSLSSSA